MEDIKNARNELFSASKTYRTNSDAHRPNCAKGERKACCDATNSEAFSKRGGSSQTAPLWNMLNRACAPSELTPDSIAAVASSFTTPISLEGNNCGSKLSNIWCYEYHLLPTWLSMAQGIVLRQGTVPTPPSTVEMLVAAPTGNCCDSALPSLENSAEAMPMIARTRKQPNGKFELTNAYEPLSRTKLAVAPHGLLLANHLKLSEVQMFSYAFS